MKSLAALLLAACAATATATALAQPLPPRPPRGDMPDRPRMPMKPDFARALDISPEKAAQVEAVFDREREEHRKVHERALADLEKILTREQIQRLETWMPRPPAR